MALSLVQGGSNFDGNISLGEKSTLIQGNRTTNIFYYHTNNSRPDDLKWTDPSDDRSRIERDSGPPLRESYGWILGKYYEWRDDPDSRVLWIKGDPGKGKTMLLCGMIEEFENSTHDTDLMPYFFCQAAYQHVNHATNVVRGLIYMLVTRCPSLPADVIAEYKKARTASFQDVNALVALSEILIRIINNRNMPPTTLIVDALDECVTGLGDLVRLICRTQSSPRIKWIVSSRNESEAEEEMASVAQKFEICLEHEDNIHNVSRAVHAYVQQKVDSLANRKRYDQDLKLDVQEYLLANANDTFLWVALVCKQLAMPNVTLRSTLVTLKSFPRGLDSLYERMLKLISASDDEKFCKRALAIATVAFEPLTLQELRAFDQWPEDCPIQYMDEIFARCGSFIAFRENYVYFVHQSAKDFLLGTAFSEIAPQGLVAEHRAICLHSIRTISEPGFLYRNINHLQDYGISNEELVKPDPDPLKSVKYACVYWIDHLCAGSTEDQGSPQYHEVHQFLSSKFLYWLEALSLLRRISQGVLSLSKLVRSLQTEQAGSRLYNIVFDASRFLQYHKATLENNPLQIYTSALAFSPSTSIVRSLYGNEVSGWIEVKSGVSKDWDACLQTIEAGPTESARITSVAFSPDGTQVASSGAGNVRIWDSITGQCLKTLDMTSFVRSVAFGDRRIASGSEDRKVRVWNTVTGRCLRTLEGHTGGVLSVAFHPEDASQVASASDDKTIRIWDSTTGDLLGVLEGHEAPVFSVVYAPYGRRIASASKDLTVRIWRVDTFRCIKTLKGHMDSVVSVAFSPTNNGRHLASASYDTTVRIWDTETGGCIQVIKHDDFLNSVAFTPAGDKLAVSTMNSLIKVWDVETGRCCQTFEEHDHPVWWVAVASGGRRLASASANRVKLWNIEGAYRSQQDHIEANPHGMPLTSERHEKFVGSVVFTPNAKQVVSAAWDNTVKIWDAETGRCLSTHDYGHLTHGHSTHHLSFDPQGRLYSDRFLIELPGCGPFLDDTDPSSPTGSPREQDADFGISDDQHWITRHGYKLLRLPPDMKAVSWAASGSTIAVGFATGQVCILELGDRLRNSQKPT